MFTYTATFYTGSLSWAGTNANVNLVLYGTDGESKEHVFKNDLETTFKSGAKDTFTIETENCLGKLEKIRVGHDNRGHLPGWKLLKVDVLDDSTGKGIEFDCYKWFDLESGDGRIQRDLYPSGDFRAKTYIYQIFIQTGDEWMSGTDANVFITLYGTKGKTDEIKLENQGSSTFEYGMINSYTIEQKFPLGTLIKVRVGHDNTGLGPGWFLEQVRVEDTVNDQMVIFPCGRWLATDSDDDMIVRQLMGDDFEKRDEEAKTLERKQKEKEKRIRRQEEERRMKEEEDKKRREREQLEKFENEKKKQEKGRKRKIEESRRKREELRRSREILHDIDGNEQERRRRESEERKKREEEMKRKEQEILQKKREERKIKRLSDQATLEELKNKYENQKIEKEEEKRKGEQEKPKKELDERTREAKERKEVEELEKKRRDKEEIQRKKEQQEKRRSLLLEERERKMRTYKVDLFTEDQFGAWTGANILLTLYGSEGQSDEHCIESEKERTFTEGIRGSLEVECPNNLGTLTHIRIGPDHTGWASPWFLVTVKDPKTENVVVFICNRLQDTEKLHSPHIYYPSNINDVDELLALESDTSDNWKKVKKTKKAQIWRKKVSELKETPPITKAELQLRGIPYKKAVKYFTDWKIRGRWDKTYNIVDIIEKIGNFKVVYCSNKMPTFCKNREMVLACLDHYDQRYHTQIMCSISHPSVPQGSKTKQIRASISIFGIIIRPVDDGTQSSKVTVITQVDLKGSAPQFVKSGYLTNSPVKWIKMLKIFYKKHKDEKETSFETTINGEKPHNNMSNK